MLSLAALATGRSFANVSVGTVVNPAAGLDVATTGSASAILVPRDSTANRPTATNGMIRYNTTANALEAFTNGAWMQFAMQPVGSTANVITSGPPVGVNIYSYTASANYTPAFGSVSNINNGIWPANGTASANNSTCLNLRDTTNAPSQVVTMDLGAVQTINNVYASLQANSGDTTLGLTFSSDGTNYTNSTLVYSTRSIYTQVYYVTFTLSPNVSARYVRVNNLTASGSGSYAFEVLCQLAFGP